MGKYTLAVLNGRLMDPETGLDMPGSVAIANGKIERLGKGAFDADTVIDAQGAVVCPGFIDIHTHEDHIDAEKTINALPVQTAAAAMKAGCTCIVGGNCGLSSFPIKAHVENLAAMPIPCYTLVGNLALRRACGLGNYDSADAAQLLQIEALASQALQEGALGISLGLQYAPGTSFEEYLALGRAARRADAFIAVHMRYDTAQKGTKSIEEVLHAARETGAKMQISHIAANIYGRDGNGQSNLSRALALLDFANGESCDVMADMYPYNVWSTTIKSAVFDDGLNEFNMDYSDLEILSGPLAGARCDEALFNQLRRAREDTLLACHNAMPAEDVEMAYTHPLVFMGSDAQMFLNEDGQMMGHPRAAASPARFLRNFIIEKKYPLLTGIRKLTLLPALRCGFANKGRLQTGMDADITVFEPDAIGDVNGFGPGLCAVPPKGIKAVIVNGRTAYMP